MKKVYQGLIERYRECLPVTDTTPIISLGEGDTPLLPLRNIPADIGFKGEIYVKCEGLNPTGSFKDRGMTLAVSKAVEEGARAIICASTGNTSASAAAYAARAGIKAYVLIPDGKIALGKLAQAMMEGAEVIQILGNFDDGMQLVKEVAAQTSVTIVNSVNPYRLQGQKTAAYEIVHALGQAPDYHCLPVGNAGNITAHWIGYSECASINTQVGGSYQGGNLAASAATAGKRPRMLGYQASGSAPFMRGAPVSNPETVATAIRIGNPQSWDYAWTVNQESQGWFDELDDAEILATQKNLAEREGVFCEPASASSLAGALRDIRSGRISKESLIVCTLTGHGLKDPDTAIGQIVVQPMRIQANLEDVKRIILKKP
ncbi:MAG: threonine synthase [Candidatus Eutrophobiaceae bacterium]